MSTNAVSQQTHPQMKLPLCDKVQDDTAAGSQANAQLHETCTTREQPIQTRTLQALDEGTQSFHELLARLITIFYVRNP